MAKKKYQENILISTEQKKVISVLKTISNGNYNKQIHFNLNGNIQNTTIDFPYTKWIQDKTVICMPKLSIQAALESEKKIWAICSDMIFFGNKSIAYANNVSIIKDKLLLQKAMLIAEHPFSTNLLSPEHKYKCSELNLLLIHKLVTDISTDINLTNIIINLLDSSYENIQIDIDIDTVLNYQGDAH